MGGGWALVFSNNILLKCRTSEDRYSSAGVGGLCIGIFSSWQGWLCVRVCVPCHVLKIAWGRVGKVMDDYICAGCFFRVTYNEKGLALLGN